MSRKLVFILTAILLISCKPDEENEIAEEVCGTAEPTAEELLRYDAEVEELGEMSEPEEEALLLPVQIPVYVWVIRSGDQGVVTRSTIDEMIRLLNSSFTGTRFSFRLAGTREVTDHPEWFQMIAGSAAERNAKRALRQGGADSLNIWTASAGRSRRGRRINGYARNGGTLDGVVVIPSRVSSTTSVHETGHWLGLLHTFSGGCSEPNDRVADTPQEASDASGCPTGRDSCPRSAGKDPIDNFMDYTTCRNRFTPGQRTLMNGLWEVEGTGELMFQGQL